MPTTEPEKEFREAFRELITMAETVRATGRVCHWGGLALEALGLPVTDIRNGGVTDIDDDATDTNDNITDTEALDFPVTDTYYGNDTDTERPDEEGGEPGQCQTRRPRGGDAPADCDPARCASGRPQRGAHPGLSPGSEAPGRYAPGDAAAREGAHTGAGERYAVLCGLGAGFSAPA
jgi:hypothetical protein